MQSFDSDGVQIAYIDVPAKEGAAGGGDPILLIHGFASTKEINWVGPSWLKTLTAVRLSLAVRLGIRTSEDAEELDELPETDPKAYVFRVYEWVAYLTENLLALA